MRRALALLALVECAAAFAGQRAIVLRDGAASIDGRLRGRQQRAYSLQLTEPVLAIEMTVEPLRSAVVELYDPEGARVPLMKEGAGRWRAAVSKPGRYSLVVARAVRTWPASWYRVRLSTR